MLVKRRLAIAALILGWGTLAAEAQQNFPRPIVLYRPPSAAPQAARPATGVPANAASNRIGIPGGPRPATITMNPSSAMPSPLNPSAVNPSTAMGSPNPQGSAQPASSATTQPLAFGQWAETPQEFAEQQARPTNQMLQNPSGSANMTHSGMSSSQQMAPNLYFGNQFQAWTNQQPVAQMPASFGEMSRFQPGPFGGYVGPNTYVGSEFSTWSNLSQGQVSPGATGSWGFSPW